MLTIELELLTGAYRASLPDSSGPEWPPHPERLFSALVQAWGDGGRDPNERAVLEWLEERPAPEIEASEYAEARTAPVVYVPPNDARGHELTVLPAQRNRQARRFQAAIPTDPIVRFRWSEAAPPDVRAGLVALSRRVASVGHSSSLVRCAIGDGDAAVSLPRWVPDERGGTMVRSLYRGRLADLEHWFETGTDRPLSRAATPYQLASRARPEITATVFGGEESWFVFEDAGGIERPDVLAFAHIARRVRDSLMSVGPQPAPTIISGHDAVGGRAEVPHIAILPLADVGWAHSSGALLGFAVVLPRNVVESDRSAALRALGAFSPDAAARVQLSRSLAWNVERVVFPERRSLQPSRYCAASSAWASVTPVALDRFPPHDDPVEEARIVAASCRNIGLPEPVEIELHKHSAWRGAPSVRTHGRGKRPDWTFPRESKFADRPRRHVVLRFDRPVRGPLVLGAGRYAGFGLCLPLGDER